ncbi:MAG: dTDP-4-amino-4,6-dideoxygalactose transaminase, partial [Rickettsiales bacterium]
AQFFQGQVDKYSWVDIGSSFLPSDIIAAYLYSQLENIEKINNRRIEIWNIYDQIFKKYQDLGYIKLVKISKECDFNAHLYYTLFENNKMRNSFIDFLKQNKISAIFHYVPLHDSVAGIKYGKTPFEMTVTNQASNNIVRMPLFYDLTDLQLEYIKQKVDKFFSKL